MNGRGSMEDKVTRPPLCPNIAAITVPPEGGHGHGVPTTDTDPLNKSTASILDTEKTHRILEHPQDLESN